MSIFGAPILGGFGFGFGGPWGFGPVAGRVDAPPDPEAPAKPSEPVERDNFAGFAAAQMGLPGFSKAPAGTDLLYWQMRKYSACVLAFAVTAGPIFAGTRTLEICKDDGTPAAKRPGGPLAGDGPTEGPEDKIKADMERHFNPLWPDILNGLEKLNFGRWIQEVRWDRKAGVTLPIEFRDFLPGMAGILYDPYGDFAGVRYNNQDLSPQYVLHHVHQPHLDRLNGYPRLENCREDWWHNHETADRLGRAERKASGISLMVLIDHEFAFKDNTGNKVSQKAAAQAFVDALSTGGSALGPRFTFKHDTIASKPELAEYKPIEAQQFDWGNTAPAILACLGVLDARDTRIVRGYGRPERESMQGKHGTNAESDTQTQTAILDSEKVHAELVGQFNRQTWRTTLVTNFGDKYLDRLYWKPTPLADDSKQFLQKAALAMLAAPGDPLPAQVDRKALLQKVELPYDESYVPQPPLLTGPTPPESGPGGGGNGQARDGSVPVRQNGNGRVRALGLSAGWEDEADGAFYPALVLSSEGSWVTINGVHVLIKGGIVVEGPRNLMGKRHGPSVGEHDIKAGDRIHVPYWNAPEGEGPNGAAVTKVGRTHVTVMAGSKLSQERGGPSEIEMKFKKREISHVVRGDTVHPVAHPEHLRLAANGEDGPDEEGPFDDYALALNCGTGAGGFAPGNTCARAGRQYVVSKVTRAGMVHGRGADESPNVPPVELGHVSEFTAAGGLADAPLPEFAAKVKALADKLPGFGDNKVYLSHVYEAAHAEDSSLTVAEFKGKMKAANTADLLKLSRADIPLNLAEEAKSEIDLGHGATAHFLLVRSDANRRQVAR